MKILVVDDEKGIQRLFQQRFRRETRSGKVELHFAFSGEEALHFLAQGGARDLTLILSDINMPKISGLELLKRIKSDYPVLKVLMITAYDDEKNRRKAILLGASDYITKPINFDELKARIFVLDDV